MSRVFLTMAMSLDGFITGPGDDADNPAGIDGMRLMDWLSSNGDGDPGGESGDEGGGAQWRPKDTQSRVVYDEAMATYQAAHERGRLGRIATSCEMFGLDEDDLRERFSPYVSHFLA